MIFDNASKCCHYAGLFHALDNNEVELDTPSTHKKSKKTGKVSYNVDIHSFVFGDRTTIISCRCPNGKRFTVLDFNNFIDNISASLVLPSVRAIAMQEEIETLRKTLTDIGMSDWKNTIASLSMNCYKANLPECPVYSHNTPEAKQIERNSFYGGQTTVFGVGHIGSTCHYVDIASMYPSIMIKHNLPTKLISCFLNVNCNPDQLATDPIDCIVKCRVHSEHVAYPVTLDNITWHCTGEFDTTLAGPEFEQAINAGHVVKVYNICEYERQPIFRDHMMKLWDKRQDFKQAGNTSQANAIKLLMNSLQGKFGQRSSDLVYRPDIYPPTRWGSWRDWSDEKQCWLTYRICADSAFEVCDKSEISGSIPAIPSYIASYGRVVMNRIRKQALPGLVYYQGVDALLVNDLALDSLSKNGMIATDTIGKLRIQHSAESATVYGYSHYRIGDKLCQTGAKTTATRTTDTMFTQKVFPTLKRAAFVGPDSQYSESNRVVFSEKTVSQHANTPFVFIPFRRL